MEKIDLNSVYIPSDDIVARDIEGEIIIVPLVAGISDVDDDLFTLNETGRIIWKLLDGEKSVNQIIALMENVYDAPVEEIKADVIGLLTELLKRRMIARKQL